MRRATYTSFLCLSLALGGCIASPQPDPPSLVTERVAPRSADRGDLRAITGEPGSVDAGPGARVFVAVLDSTAPISGTEVAPDGSFVVRDLTIRDGDEVRLWVRDGDARSAPFDGVVSGDVFVDAPRPLPCVRVTPSDTLEIEASPGSDATGTLLIENECGAPIAIESAVLRAPAAAISIGSVPADVAPSASLPITFTASPGADLDEILLITFVGAERERRPITIHGAASD